MAAWLFAPDINHMRPDIESVLKQQLQLKSLKLEGLSWYWAGTFGFQAEHCSLQKQDESMQIDDAKLTVRISFPALLHGKLWPERVALQGGKLQCKLTPKTWLEQTNLPNIRLILDDMQVHWQYASYQGNLNHVALDLDMQAGKSTLRMPGLRLQAHSNPQGLPISAHWHFDSLQWLPLELQHYVQGQTAGEVTLKQLNSEQWRIDLSAQGSPAAIHLPNIGLDIPFEQLGSSWLIRWNQQTGLQQWEINDLNWLHGQNKGHGSGQWQQGTLTLDVTSPHLDMPLLWSWMRPLDDANTWHSWLKSMQQGVASEISMHSQLPWKNPLRALPNSENWQAMTYQATAHIQHADTGLGFANYKLREIDAEVELNEAGLNMQIQQAQLPENIGTWHGSLHMPWKNMRLSMKGQSEFDLSLVHQWLDPKKSQWLQWSQAQSVASTQMQWKIGETTPHRMHISIKPKQPWQLQPQGLHLQVKSGEINWDLKQGLDIQKLDISGHLLNGELSLKAQQTKDTRNWQLQSLHSSMHGDFAQLSNYYHFPIEQPLGNWQAQLDFNQTWHGQINLQDAAWKNLLGSVKEQGKVMRLHFKAKQQHNELNISQISSQNDSFLLQGTGHLNARGLRLNLAQLKSPVFDGKVNILAPFGTAPWEMNISAAYLNRKALPQHMTDDPAPLQNTFADKPWALNAKIEHFVWDDTNMQGVTIKLASKPNSTSFLEAKHIHAGTLELQNASALFALTGDNEIDLRQLSASMGKQHLNLSARLHSNENGGMHWRGFAQLSGDFGDIMQQAKLTSLFKGGDLQALFLGEGTFIENQVWWKGLQGRLRMRINDGTILKGGTLSKTLAAISLLDLPKLLLGQRKDLTQEGLYYRRLQIEGSLHDQMLHIKKLALRSSAMDIAGQGKLNLDSSEIDMQMIARPFQNLDAILAKIPLLRDLFGGSAHSFLRKIYRMHGPVANAAVDAISPEQAGIANSGLIESLLSLPNRWFGNSSTAKMQ